LGQIRRRGSSARLCASVQGAAQLAAEYPCMVVRTARELNAETSSWLLESHTDHCLVEGIPVYTVGIPCEKIRRAAQSDWHSSM
jgi:hypothetical protein